MAVEAARENARRNDVGARFEVADVLADPLPPADVALANIALDAVEQVAARVDADRLIASGYPARDRLTAPGWRRAERLERDGWAADLLTRA